MATERAEQESAQATESMTEAEALAFTEKLRAWAETLGPKEQAALAALFRRGAGDGADVAGHIVPDDPTSLADVIIRNLSNWGPPLVLPASVDVGDIRNVRQPRR